MAQVLTGGAGADFFYFDTGSGRDNVMDFVGGDMLHISQNLWSYGVAYLLAHNTSQTDAGLVITFARGDQILLLGITTVYEIADAIQMIRPKIVRRDKAVSYADAKYAKAVPAPFNCPSIMGVATTACTDCGDIVLVLRRPYVRCCRNAALCCRITVLH